MVAHLVRLKLTLLRNIFRRSRAQAIGALLGILYAGFLVVLLALAIVTLRGSLEEARIVIPLGGAVGLALWALVPVLAFGSDPTLDPQRFVTFAIPHRELAIGLVVAALLGLPALATTVLALATVVAWSYTPLSALVALAAAAVGVLTCVTLSRWVSAVATSAVSSRRGRDLAGVIGVLLLAVLGPVIGLTQGVGETLGTSLRTIVDVVSWSPLGLVWAAPGDVAAGDTGTGLLRLVLGVGFLGLLGWLWTRAVRRQVEDPQLQAGRAGTRRATGLGLFDRTPDTPAGAVAARCLTYWLRDPRYQVNLLMAPIVPLFLLVPHAVGNVAWAPLLMAPLVAFLLGFAEHNSVSYDHTAFWQHVAAGVPGRADRWGRLIPTVLLALVLLPAYSVLGGWMGGRPDLITAILGVAAALLGAGYAVASALSVLLPYPVPKPGESPFSTAPGATGASLLAQTVASTSTALLASPVLVLGWVAWSGTTWAAWPALGLGVALGVGLTVLGVRVGGAIYERRAPEVLAELTQA